MCRDAESLVNGEISSFDFIVSLIIWYEILYRINLVGKKLQSKDTLLDVIIENLKGLVVYFKKYREIGFACVINKAKEIANSIGVDPEFTTKRSFSRKNNLMKF